MGDLVPAEVRYILDTFVDPAVLISPDYHVLAANTSYRREYGDPGGGRTHCYRISHHYALPCDQVGESCPLKAYRETGTPQKDLHLHHTPGGEVAGPLPGEIIPLQEMERRYLRWSLAHYQGDKRSLARRPGLSERTLYRKLRELKPAHEEEG